MLSRQVAELRSKQVLPEPIANSVKGAAEMGSGDPILGRSTAWFQVE
jgi:hypothetical protein